MEILRLQAIPYLIMSMLLIWNGLLFISFHSRFPHGWLDAKGYLFFGLTSLILSGFVLGSMGYLYGPTKISFIIVSARGFALTIYSIFFFLFSASYLKLKNLFWWISPVLVSLVMAPLFFFPNIMVHPVPYTYEAVFWNVPIIQTMWKLGIGSRIFMAWLFIFTLIHYVLWIRVYRKTRHGFSMVVGFSAFLVVAIYQVGIQLQWYSGPALFDFAFFSMLAVISFRLFSQVMELNRAYSIKSRDLQKTNQEVHFLLRAISHDVVGPLVSIHGFSDLLAKEGRIGKSLNEKQSHYLERILTNVDRMESLIEGILEYLMADPAKAKLSPINCQKVLQEILMEISINEKLKDIKTKPIIKIIGEWPRNFWFSKEYFKYILINLIENAAIHGRSPSEKVQPAKITLEGKVDLGVFRMAVKDEGHGIPQQFREKIFDIDFFQDRGAMMTGLGLPTIKKIVESFSGKVWVDPEYTRGACIRITLPDDLHETTYSL